MDRPPPKQQLGGKPQQVALKQALATTVASQLPIASQCTPSSPQLLAHLTAPQSIRGPSTALSFHFPFTIGSLSPVTCSQAVGRLVYSQPVSLAGTGFTVVSPSSSIPALQVLGSNAFQSHLSSTGMMMVPTLTAGQVKVSSSITGGGSSLLPANVPDVASCGVPVILQSQHSAPELNFILTSPAAASQLQQQQQSLLSTNLRSFSGTVHHKGVAGLIGAEGGSKLHTTIQSPARELSFAHLKSQLKQESSFSLIAKSKRPRSESVGGVKTFGMFEAASGSLLDDASGELPLPPAKKIKLEAELSNDAEVSTYRSLYCEDRERELERKNEAYQSLIMELFFLENGGRMLDYFGWQKRSAGNGQLLRYMRSRKADDLGEYGGQEKSINNEVKVLTTSGGTLPIVTPVAISKTLPPAITAMQQQQQQENAGSSNGGQLMSRKAGGRHGMVYGYVSPKAIQQCPLVPGGIPLSTTAATTTVGSPPPYTVECSSSSTAVVTIVAVTTTTVTMTSALPRARMAEGICQPTIGTGGCHVTDVYQPSLMGRDQLLESRRDRLFPVALDAGAPDTSSATPAISQEAVVELAKQEAQVMQRVAELRKQGLWSLKQLPKVQEPTRHKSHWDYVLDEMQWMAVDFAQEKRWKMSCAKHVAVSIMKQHDRRQLNLKLRHTAEEQRMKALAGAVGKMITDFWSSMIEMTLYKRQKDVELKHRKLLSYVACEALTSSLESAENEDTCIEDTSAKTTTTTTDEQRRVNEIDDLIKERDMPLDELVKKYAGAYSKEFEDDYLMQLQQTASPANSSCSSNKKNGSSDGENADVEDVVDTVAEADAAADIPKVVVNDPIDQMIRTALSLQPTSSTCDLDTVSSDKRTSSSSSLMKLKLRDYQIVGANWISAMHLHRISCILSDEKGLGKKVQAIHFLSDLASEQGNWGPHLIVSPSGSLFIWRMVFSRWCPALRMFVFCGDGQERFAQRLDWLSSDAGHYHVCLTSYNCITEDAQFFSEQTWNSLILDQADSTDSSDVCKQLQHLSVEHRLLLTDLDLSSPTVSLKQVFDLVVLAFSENLYHDFKERCGRLLSKDLSTLESGSKEYSDLTKIVHEITSALSLRRCKEDVSGQLPKLDITTVQCPLTKRQQLLYSQLISSDETKGMMKVGRISDVLSLILKLKMVCNHPDLIVESCAALLPLVVDGMPLSMPSLLDGALRQDSLNTTGAWSAVTSLVRLEQDSACPVASYSSKQKPLIEELPCKSAASAGESAMDIDVENTDYADLSVCEAGGGGDAAAKLSEMGRKEKQRTDSVPDDNIKALYGVGLQGLLRSMTSELTSKQFECGQWSSQGYMMSSLDGQQLDAQRTKTTVEATDSFMSLLNVSSDCVKSLTDAMAPVCSSRVVIQTGKMTQASHSTEECDSSLESTLRGLTAERKAAKPRSQLTLANSGKLQLLDMLMKQLISDQQRVVILSHMTHMLDLLEAYLDVCMLLYVRIDGSTKAKKRHLIVQRFNTNPKICCLLLSSRTPYLRGCEWPSADAVVLFDVDLSPSMKRHTDEMLQAMTQASSGLTVFRFITPDTIEEFLLSREGILQKGIISQDDGATYTQETLSQLFRRSSLVEELTETKLPTPDPADVDLTEFPEEIFETALNFVADAEDTEAARLVNAQREVVSGPEADEVAALKMLDAEADKVASPEAVKLSEIEEYAVTFIERNLEMLSKNVIKQEDNQDYLVKVANPNKRKLEYDVKTEFKVKEEEDDAEEKSGMEDDGLDDLLFTYPMDRENKQVFVSDVTGEQMPIWMPPTPPQDDSDVYVDISLYFLYEPSMMSESQLPQVYVKKGHKRMKTDNANTRRVKVHREEQQLVPRSLFERPLALIRGERESRLLKQGQTKMLKSSGAMVPVRPMPEPPSDQPDWLIHEDWALLQAYQMHQELPVVSSLDVMSSHSSNWDVISDIVNVCSRTYRTPKQCKNRFDNVILPREEGKFLYDINPRKLKKSNKGLYKTKNNQPMRTNQLYVQDNSRALTTCFMLHIEALKGLPPKRSTTLGTTATTIGGTRNTKHIAALVDLSLNYDQPVSPLQIAAMRAERLAKDKKQATTPTATASTGDQQPALPSVVNTQLRLATQQSPGGAPVVIQTGQLPTQALLQTQQQLVSGQHVATAAPAAVVSASLTDNRQQQMTIVQATGQQLQAVASGSSALLTTSLHKVVGSSTSGVTSVSLPRNLTMTGIVVTQSSGLNRPQTVVSSAALVNLPANLNQTTVRAIRNVVPLTIRDAVTPAISHSTINISAQDARSLAQVIATTGLTTTQLVVTQQKPTVGMPHLGAGSVQQQMLSLTGAGKSQTAATIPALQVQMRQQRVGTAVLQPVRPLHLMQNQMTALLRKQPQAKTATAAAAGTIQGSLSVQQIPRQQQQQQQQIEGVTLQQQQLSQQQGATSSAVTQSVTTLLKAVTPAASLSTVTIPVSAVSLGINVTHPKLVSGKAANSPQQLRQLQVPKRGPAVQFAASKVTALGPLAKSVSSSPVIIQQQKFLPQALPTRYQHLISSSSGTVIAAQIIHQSNAQPSLPASVTPAAAAAGSKAGSVTVTIAGSTGLSGVATIPMSSLCQQVSNASVATTAVRVMPTTQGMMYATKPNKDGFLGIQKTTMVVPAGLQQVTVRPASATTQQQQPQQQQQQPTTSQLLQGAHITMTTSNKAVGSLTPVEKAVQEVVQQAQAQARQVPPIGFTGTNVVVSAVPQGGGSQTQVVATVPAPQHLLVTSVMPQPATVGGAVSAALSPATGSDDSQHGKSSASGAMKLRNQRP